MRLHDSTATDDPQSFFMPDTDDVPAGPRRGGRLGLLAIGLAVVVVGFTWFGVHDKQTIEAQVPYLVSGGLLSVILSGVGAALLVLGGIDRQAAELRSLRGAVRDLAELTVLESQAVEESVHALSSLAGERPAAQGRR